MSVDYEVCDSCGETFCDCGDYVSCECGRQWCCDECAINDGFTHTEWEDYNEESSCTYCRKEDFDDDVLLEFALKLLTKTRKELITEYKELI